MLRIFSNQFDKHVIAVFRDNENLMNNPPSCVYNYEDETHENNFISRHGDDLGCIFVAAKQQPKQAISNRAEKQDPFLVRMRLISWSKGNWSGKPQKQRILPSLEACRKESLEVKPGKQIYRQTLKCACKFVRKVIKGKKSWSSVFLIHNFTQFSA